MTPPVIVPELAGRRWAAPLAEALFEALAAARRAPALHPQTAAFTAHAALAAEPRLLPLPIGADGARALLRVSRGIGLPRGLGDVYGVGLRLLDALGPGRHQDLLVSSCWPGRAGRFLPRPRRPHPLVVLSCLIPYRTPAGLCHLIAEVSAPAGLDAVIAGESDDVRVALREARVLAGARTVATVAPGQRLSAADDAELRLNPWNTHAGLRPAGWINALRDPAYRGSHRGRRRTGR